MGLDIYFHKRNADKYNKVVEEANQKSDDFWIEWLKKRLATPNPDSLRKYIDMAKASYISDMANIEVAYFRKVNFLMSFFNYEGNCEDKRISKEEVEALLDACEREVKGEEVLEPTAGFFFGSTDRDEFFYEQISDVIEKFTNILNETDWESEEVYMYCWW